MATATFKRGEIRTAKYLAGADIVVDQIILMNSIDTKKGSIGISRQAISNGDVGIVGVSGVFEFPKVSAAVIKAGEAVNWDASTGEVDDNAATAAVGDLVDWGKAMEDAGNGDTVIDIDISEPGTYKGS